MTWFLVEELIIGKNGGIVDLLSFKSDKRRCLPQLFCRYKISTGYTEISYRSHTSQPL